jgi:Cu-processing system permease protein
MHTLVIARLTFLEASRRRILLAGLILGLAFLIMFSLGLFFIHREIDRQVQQGAQVDVASGVASKEFYNFIFMAGLYSVNFLSVAMGALITADTLAGEIGSGTVQSVVTKPVRRFEVVLGKWLGFAFILTLYLLLMIGGVSLSVWVQTGYIAPHIGSGIALMYLESLLMMTITLACSSTFSTLATGGIVFGLYGLAFIGGWVEQIGTLLKNTTAVNVGIVASLMIPSEVLWKRAAYEMQSPLVGAMGVSPFSSTSVPSPIMIVYAALYLLVFLGLAIYQFNRRDL